MAKQPRRGHERADTPAGWLIPFSHSPILFHQLYFKTILVATNKKQAHKKPGHIRKTSSIGLAMRHNCHTTPMQMLNRSNGKSLFV